ncbi:MAG: InlB B-repeat-containing protein, partial [Firmicutes bacterium]|nr:InlB B-repeat-containing protein [Bacillota bacterium]
MKKLFITLLIATLLLGVAIPTLAMQPTVINVTSQQTLLTALETARSNPNTPYDIHISSSFSISNGTTLTVPANVWLYIDAGATLSMNGGSTKLVNNGVIHIYGTLNHSSNIYNQGLGKVYVYPGHKINGNTKFISDGDPIVRPDGWLIEFNANGGIFADGTLRVSEHVSDDNGAQLISPPVLGITKAGFILDGWYTAIDGGVKWDFDVDKVSGNTVLFAHWANAVFTVVFLDWDDTVLLTVDVPYGSQATPPANPNTKTNYHFVEWDNEDFDYVTENMTIKAIYSINTYDVEFFDWDGERLSLQVIEHGSAATAPTAKDDRPGHHFVGWLPADFTNITENLSVHAHYERNTYTVTFVDWNDAVLATVPVLYEQAAQEPAHPDNKPYYFFVGWDKDFSKVVDNITVKALYEPHEFAITYILGEDGVNDDDNPGEYNIESPTITLKDPTREGYTFVKWEPGNTIPTGSFGEKTFTAIWEANAYTITYILNDGTNDAANPGT